MINHSRKTPQSGFTLLEVLLVVAAIAILAGIVIFAINPGKQLAEMRNGQRRADVNLIVNALYQYMIDNGGTIANIIPTKGDVVCKDQTDVEICKTGLTQCSVILDPLTNGQKYLVSAPVDPAGGVQSGDGSGYYVYVNANNRITACAPNAELGVSISVTR